MSYKVIQFKNDDAHCLPWLQQHPKGVVLNELVIHDTTCQTISFTLAKRPPKDCFEDVGELRAYQRNNPQLVITRCSRCNPPNI